MAVTMKTATHPRTEAPADLILNTPKIINITTTLQIVPESTTVQNITTTLQIVPESTRVQNITTTLQIGYQRALEYRTSQRRYKLGTRQHYSTEHHNDATNCTREH